MAERRIRPTAYAVIRRGRDQILCSEYHRSTGEPFYRPPGGAIEFGESAVDAVQREIAKRFQPS